MRFDFQPVLVGDLLQARPLRADDFDDLYAVAADPLLWAQHPRPDRCERPVFQQFFRDALASGGALTVIDNGTGRLIGSSRYHGYDARNSEIEIGWTFLARSHWGGTYNGELKRLMLRHAFAFVDTAVFLIGQTNFRSQQAMEKIGGVRSGTRSDTHGLTSVVYRIDSRTWATGGQ